MCSKQSRYLWNTKILFHVFNKELSTIVQTKVTAMKCKTAQCNKMLRSAVQCSKRLCNAYQWSEVHLDQNWAKSRHLLFKTFELSNAMDSRIVQWCMVWLCINLSSMQYKVALYSGWFGFVLIFWVFWSPLYSGWFVSIWVDMGGAQYQSGLKLATASLLPSYYETVCQWYHNGMEI